MQRRTKNTYSATREREKSGHLKHARFATRTGRMHRRQRVDLADGWMLAGTCPVFECGITATLTTFGYTTSERRTMILVVMVVNYCVPFEIRYVCVACARECLDKFQEDNGFIISRYVNL